MQKKICVLASGGDCPGMNTVVEVINMIAIHNGIEVWGARNGFNGLLDGDVYKLGYKDTQNISHQSGCILGSNRTPRMTQGVGFRSVIENIKKHDFTAVIVLGGNGSLIGSGRLKNAGVNVLYIPSTIDNDVPGYKNALGFSSACEESVRLIDNIKLTMMTSERDHIVQLMGRKCPELALKIGTATLADIIDMEGARVTPSQVAKVFIQNRKAGKKSNMLVMQERVDKNAVCEFTENAKFLGDVSKACESDNTRMSVLGYLQRGAGVSCHDRFLAVQYGKAAVDAVMNNKFGVGVYMTDEVLHYNDIELAPIPK